jgi:hypothetical protein
MDFIYTAHAEENILKRRLNKSIVEKTIQNPERIEVSRFGRKITQKTMDNKLLRVVYAEEHGIYIIITAYYTELHRYR